MFKMVSFITLCNATWIAIATVDSNFLTSIIQKFNVDVLIETSGTVDNEIILQAAPLLKEVYLVRNEMRGYQRTGKFFMKEAKVRVYPGPSEDALSLFLPFIKGKVLFILGCPDAQIAQKRTYNQLFQDIRIIIACAINQGVVLIDNYHYFRTADYPTELYVRGAISDINAQYKFVNHNDILLSYLP